MDGYDLRVFETPEQQGIVADILAEVSKLNGEQALQSQAIARLEREIRWLKRHMPEPDLRYMG